MKKRFVVCLNPGTPEQDGAFKDFLNNQRLGWWHWIGGSWLVVDATGNMTAAVLRDAADEAYPGLYNIVLEFCEDGSFTWAGFGPIKPPKNMFEWIRQNWGEKVTAVQHWLGGLVGPPANP